MATRAALKNQFYLLKLTFSFKASYVLVINFIYIHTFFAMRLILIVKYL